jgi:hypothetical protein
MLFLTPVDHGYATGSYTHWQCSINTTVRQYAIDQSISFHDARTSVVAMVEVLGRCHIWQQLMQQ